MIKSRNITFNFQKSNYLLPVETNLYSHHLIEILCVIKYNECMGLHVSGNIK